MLIKILVIVIGVFVMSIQIMSIQITPVTNKFYPIYKSIMLFIMRDELQFS